MRFFIWVLVTGIIFAGCSEKNECPPNSPCWSYKYEFGPVTADTFLYNGDPFVTLLDGQRAQIHALYQSFRSVNDESIGGYIYSYVLRPINNPDVVLMETIGVFVAWNTVAGAELTGALTAPAASRIERIAHVRGVLETCFDMYHPRSGPPATTASVIQEPPPGLVGDKLYCMMISNFSDYICPMPPP